MPTAPPVDKYKLSISFLESSISFLACITSSTNVLLPGTSFSKLSTRPSREVILFSWSSSLSHMGLIPLDESPLGLPLKWSWDPVGSPHICVIAFYCKQNCKNRNGGLC